MGLDMYLMKELTVYGEFDHRKVNKDEIKITTNGKEYSFYANEISEVTFQLLYWRKANAIHSWFVRNIQNGVDDCGRYNVSRAQLKELVKVCKQTLFILDKADYTEDTSTDFFTNKEFTYKTYNVDEDELPLTPTAGFFFGSLNIDEWFYSDVERTVKVLEKELETPEDCELSYIYHSSW